MVVLLLAAGVESCRHRSVEGQAGCGECQRNSAEEEEEEGSFTSHEVAEAAAAGDSQDIIHATYIWWV